MKSIIRFGIVAVVVALLISAIGVPVRAQGTPPNPCFDLKADDCKIITDGMANLAKVTSTNFTWALSVKTDGMPDAAGTLDVTGAGSTFVPPSTGTTPSAGDPMTAAVGALATLQFQTTIESKGTMGTQDMGLSLELRITGNTLYLKGDKLTGGKWMALKLDELLTSAMGMASGMMSGGGIPGMPSGAPGASGLTGLASDPELLNAIMQIPNIPGVIKVTRDADQDATDKSEKYAQFTYTLDLVTLVKAKEFLPIVKAIAAQAMASRLGGSATPGATPV